MPKAQLISERSAFSKCLTTTRAKVAMLHVVLGPTRRRLDIPGRIFKSDLDYVTRRFNPEGLRGWDTALRDFQIKLEPESAKAMPPSLDAPREEGSWFRAELDCT